MAKRLMKYNPAFLSDDELIQSFVVRQTDLDLILEVLRENVTTSNQHVLVIGPRGSGKTTLALRVATEVRRAVNLKDRWYPLVYSEESYKVSTAGEFWLESLFHLGQKTGDSQWQRAYEELSTEQNEGRLRERALALLMDFADSQGKRILLIVENLNMLLGKQINSDNAWALRHTLQNEPRLMLLATATSRFDEVDKTDQPMFELFKHHELRPLDEAECRKVWTSITGNEPGDERIRPIQILTGGNPRLLSIISSFGAKLSFQELMGDLMRLVDDHTEYFKSQLDNLPPKERKVYLALAELWDPATARAVAKSARIDVNKTSSNLGRLVNRGAVTVSSEGPRTKWYQVAERMYNIYHLMRRRGEPSSRVRAVVRFMVSFYGSDELVHATSRLAEEACRLHPGLCRDHYTAFEAILKDISSEKLRKKIIFSTPRRFFEGADIPATLKNLFEKECVEPMTEKDSKLEKLLEEADTLGKQPQKVEDVKVLYQQAVSLAPNSSDVWLKYGLFLESRKRYDEAEAAFRKVIDLEPEKAWGWINLGSLMAETKRYDEAEAAFRKAIDLEPAGALGWMNLGSLMAEAKRYDEAEAAFRKVIDLKPEKAWGWMNLGFLMRETKRYDEAEATFRKVIDLKPEKDWGWINLGFLMRETKRYDEAEAAFRKVIELKPEKDWGWVNLGLLMRETKRYDEAEAAFRKVIDLEPEKDWGWMNLGSLMAETKRYDEAETAYRKVLDLQPKNTGRIYQNLVFVLLQNQERSTEALSLAEEGLRGNPNDDVLLNGLAWVFYEYGERYTLGNALTWVKEAVALQPDNPAFHHTLGCILCALGNGTEALVSAKKYLDDCSLVEKALEDTTELFVNLAAAGQGREALEMIRKSSSANVLEPLVVGLQIFLGDDVKSAVEIAEVGRDVAARIRRRQEKWDSRKGK